MGTLNSSARNPWELSPEFSRVAADTWCIFSSYGGYGHLKLEFVQRSQDSCLVMSDTSRSETMLDRKIQTLLDMSREAKCPLLVGTIILVFLSIFTKSQVSSPFEALNSAHRSMSQMDVRPSVQKRLRTMTYSRVSTGVQTCLHLVRLKMSLHLRHCRESRLSFESGLVWVHYT